MRLHHALVFTLLLGSTFTACDSKSGDGKAKADAKDAKAKTDLKAQSKADPKAADAKAADAKAADAKAADAKVDEAKVDEAKADEAKADGGTADAKAEPLPPAPAPATAEEAAKQLAAWLADPAKAPPPALLGATSELELAEFCGACDDEKKAKTSKLAGLEAVTKRAGELRGAVASESISAEAKLECKDDCCTFVPEAGTGVGDNVVNVEKICMTVGKDGKPTAYTRLETSGSY